MLQFSLYATKKRIKFIIIPDYIEKYFYAIKEYSA